MKLWSKRSRIWSQWRYFQVGVARNSSTRFQTRSKQSLNCNHACKTMTHFDTPINMTKTDQNSNAGMETCPHLLCKLRNISICLHLLQYRDFAAFQQQPSPGCGPSSVGTCRSALTGIWCWTPPPSAGESVSRRPVWGTGPAICRRYAAPGMSHYQCLTSGAETGTASRPLRGVVMPGS